MKKLLVSIILLSFVKSHAQFTITSTYKPAIGDSYNYYEADTTGVTLGSSGPAQTWNYTSLSIPSGSTLQSTAYIDATSIPNYTWYPGAYMAITNGSWHYCYDSDPNNLSMNWGVPTDTGPMGYPYCIKYTNPYSKYHYPIFFNSTFSDSMKTVGYDQHPPTPSIIPGGYDEGINTYTCTGYGTLNLPVGISLSNTLKLDMLYSKTSYTYSSVDTTILFTDSTFYEEYFNTISKFPVLTIINKYFTSYAVTPPYKQHTKTIRLNQSVSNFIKEEDSEGIHIDIFPNPSSSIFNIRYSSLHNIRTPFVNLFNSLGQQINLSEDQFKISQNTIHLDLTNYSSGIYYLKLSFGDKNLTKKLLVK